GGYWCNRQRCACALVVYPVALDISRSRAVWSADRGNRTYFDRCCRSAAAVGASAVALSPDMGAGVPVASAVATQMDADVAAGGRCRSDGAARRWWRAEPAVDPWRSSVVLLHHRDGLSRRTRTYTPGGELPHRILCRALVWRHGWWVVCRLDRALH